MRLIAAGLVAGSAIALAAGRSIEGVLFQESSRDPIVFVAAAVILLPSVLVCVGTGASGAAASPPPTVRWASLGQSGQDLVWRDVTNSDHVNIDLRFADGSQASFLHSDIASALKPKWYLLATAGGVVGDWRRESVLTRGTMDELVEDRLAPADSPARLTVFRPNGEGGVAEEVLALPRRVRNAFYRNLADHLLLGEPLSVPPEDARRNIAVMEAATHSIAQGGRPVRVGA